MHEFESKSEIASLVGMFEGGPGPSLLVSPACRRPVPNTSEFGKLIVHPDSNDRVPNRIEKKRDRRG